MLLDHTLIECTSDRLALNKKRIAFRLRVSKTSKIAEGIGTLHICEDPDGKASCMLDITRWPEHTTGILRINEFWLTDEEMDLIRPSENSDAEIECIDPRIPSL